MEKMKTYPPSPRGADYVAAWAQMQHYDGRQHRIKVVCRKGKYCCYIGTSRVCAFTYVQQAVHWMQAAIHRHTENGFKILRYVPWGGCMERRQLIYGGCDYCPWQYECIAHEKVVCRHGGQ
jgi:hypothetical protein